MLNKKIFHDASIIGLLYKKDEQKMCIQIEIFSGKKVLLEFNKVVGWDLSPFEAQNILYDMHEYNNTKLPDWIIRDFDIPKEYIVLIQAGKNKLFYLEPSIGLGGYIIAENQLCMENFFSKIFRW